MKFITKCFSFLLVMVIAACGAKTFIHENPEANESYTKELGHFTYFFKGGKVRILSQKDRAGKTAILLECCNKNTGIEIEDLLVNEENNYYLKTTMYINIEDSPFASLIHEQSLNVFIEPLPVEEITLHGKVIANGELLIIFKNCLSL